MRGFEQHFFPNEQCKDYSLRNQGNIARLGKYVKDKSLDLLCWQTCSKWFVATKSSALFDLQLSAKTIRQIIHQAAEGCPRASCCTFI